MIPTFFLSTLFAISGLFIALVSPVQAYQLPAVFASLISGTIASGILGCWVWDKG